MLIGYMRVSSESDRQKTDLQRDALLAAALNGGMSKAAVCRSFGVKRTTLIDTLARIGPGVPESVTSP